MNAFETYFEMMERIGWRMTQIDFEALRGERVTPLDLACVRGT
jgi:hypothetical protein